MSRRNRLIAITVDMRPVGKQRPIVTRFHGTFTPKQTVQAEHKIAWKARAAMKGKPPSDKPVHLFIGANFALPKSASKKDRENLPGTLRDKKPDLDNIEKLVSDALNGVVWVDDKQVVSHFGKKTNANEDSLRIIVDEYPV